MVDEESERLSTSQTGRDSTRIVSIELLRFVAALAVLLWHYQHFFVLQSSVAFERNMQPFYAQLSLFYNFGMLGVDVFWCVSGFIFFFKYQQLVSSGTISALKFSLNRFSRLYPLHFLTLILVLVGQYFYQAENGSSFIYTYNDAKHFLLNALFVSGWGLESGHSFNGPIWSVSMEILVYLLFYVLLRQTSLFRAYMFAILFFVLCDVMQMAELSLCIAYFFAGGAVALCKLYPPCFSLSRIGFRTAFGSFGLVLVTITICTGVSMAYSSGSPYVLRNYLSILFNLEFVTCLVYLFVWLNPFLSSTGKVWEGLGSLTYASYLLHFPIQLFMVLVIPLIGLTIDLRSPALLLTYLALVLVLSWLVYRHVEMPIQKRIRAKFS